MAILNTTIALLGEMSLHDLSMEAIARESGTSKATIYRWWPSKAAVVIEAFISYHVIRTPVRHDFPAKKALALHIATMIRQYSGPSGRLVAQIIAAGQSDPDIAREWRERFLYGRRAALRELLARGVQTGEFNAKFDPEFILDVLYAPIYMRLLLGHLPLDEEFAKRLPETVIPLLTLG